MARKTTAQVKRRLVLTVPITLAIILATTFTSVLELKKIRSYEKEKKTLTLELEKLKEDAESLNLEINRLNSPEYIARYAREKFLYTKDGEKLIIVEESNKEIDYLTYILIGVGSLLFITIVHIIVKKSKKA